LRRRQVAPFPQTFGKNYDAVVSVVFIVESEQAAQDGLYSEHREGGSSDAFAIGVFGLALAGQGPAAIGNRRYCGETCR